VPNSTQTAPVRVSPLLVINREAIVDCQGLRLEQRPTLTAIQVLAFAKQFDGVAKAITKALGVECPTKPGVCNSKDSIQVTWTGPNNWIVICEEDDSLLAKLKMAVGKKAAVVDQSHGRCGIRLSGVHARSVMAKNCALDFHPDFFKAGNSALTSVAHMNALIIQVDDESYDLFVARSLARSFVHAIEHSCAEFAKA
jgi:heterotetrameric sarcosine oxidase gamma subunit|tara:strand:- start:451 stop:1041 length:591 start_codon:yes stop_codon:yes gene_type:complete